MLTEAAVCLGYGLDAQLDTFFKFQIVEVLHMSSVQHFTSM